MQGRHTVMNIQLHIITIKAKVKFNFLTILEKKTHKCKKPSIIHNICLIMHNARLIMYARHTDLHVQLHIIIEGAHIN